MNTQLPLKRTRWRGFSIIEVLVCVGIISVVVVSLYSGLSMCVGFVQLARENLRAAQILQEKMETIRLYNWDQVTKSGFIPTSFTAPFYTLTEGGNAPTDGNFDYTGTLVIKPVPFEATYKDEMKMVEVAVIWTSGKVVRTRTVSTFVSRMGIQNYIY